MNAEQAHGNPGAEVNPVSTNQVKLDKNPSPAKVEYMKKCHESREHIGKLPIGKDDKGAPVYVGKNWAVAHALICLMDGLKAGKVKWDDVLSWYKSPKETSKPAAKPSNTAVKPSNTAEKAAKPAKASKPSNVAAKTKKPAAKAKKAASKKASSKVKSKKEGK